MSLENQLMTMSLRRDDNGGDKDHEPNFCAKNGRLWPASAISCLCVVIKYAAFPSTQHAEILGPSGGSFSVEDFADCLNDGQAYPSLKHITPEETSAFSAQVTFEFNSKWLEWTDQAAENDVGARLRYMIYLFQANATGNGKQEKKKFDGWMKLNKIEYKSTELGFRVTEKF